jgi:hypothetical protein
VNWLKQWLQDWLLIDLIRDQVKAEGATRSLEEQMHADFLEQAGQIEELKAKLETIQQALQARNMLTESAPPGRRVARNWGAFKSAAERRPQERPVA